MKRKSLIACVLAAVLLSGCGSQQSASTSASVAEESAGTVSSAVSDTEGSVSESASTGSESQLQAVQMLEAGGYVQPVSSATPSAYAFWGVKLNNPNTNAAVYLPEVLAQFKDDSGSVLATASQSGMYIMPGDTITLVNISDIGVVSPTNAYYQLQSGTFVDPASLDVPSTSDFSISNIAESQNSLGTPTVTGLLTYNGSHPCSTVCVTALYKKSGSIVFAGASYVDTPTSGQQVSFEINSMTTTIPEHDSVEVSAQFWT